MDYYSLPTLKGWNAELAWWAVP